MGFPAQDFIIFLNLKNIYLNELLSGVRSVGSLARKDTLRGEDCATLFTVRCYRLDEFNGQKIDPSNKNVTQQHSSIAA